MTTLTPTELDSLPRGVVERVDLLEGDTMTTELDFLRKLEQDLQHLHERVRKGYSGVPEVTAIKREINQRIIDLLKEQQLDDDD